jgi:iron(III) transport system substrate-binding protein
MTLDRLYAAAKQEGQVVIWGPDDPSDMDCYAKAFGQRFPGVQINHFEITAGEAASRIVTEAQAGKMSLDASSASLDTVEPLIQRDLVAGYDDWSTLFGIPSGAVSSNGRLISFYHLSHPLGINTQALGSLPVPTSWDDLLNPIYKGQIMLEARGKPFGMLGVEWGEAKLRDYLTHLMTQQPKILKGGTTILTALSAGESAIAIGTYGYKIKQFSEQEGAPITYGKFSPMAASSFQVFTMKGAAHPNAGRLLVGWLGGAEGQQVQEQCSSKSSLVPGAPGALSQDYQQNNIRLIFESVDNFDQGTRYEDIAARIIGGK